MAEKTPQKPVKKSQAEDAISDDEDEPVSSFFTFSEKSVDITYENKKTFPSHDTKSSSGVKSQEPSLDVINPSGPPLLHGKMLSSSTASQSSRNRVTEIAPSPVMEEPIRSTQTAIESEETLSTGELETRTYYYEQQPEQPGGYSAHEYVSNQFKELIKKKCFAAFSQTALFNLHYNNTATKKLQLKVHYVIVVSFEVFDHNCLGSSIACIAMQNV